MCQRIYNLKFYVRYYIRYIIKTGSVHGDWSVPIYFYIFNFVDGISLENIKRHRFPIVRIRFRNFFIYNMQYAFVAVKVDFFCQCSAAHDFMVQISLILIMYLIFDILYYVFQYSSFVSYESNDLSCITAFVNSVSNITFSKLAIYMPCIDLLLRRPNQYQLIFLFAAT